MGLGLGLEAGLLSRVEVAEEGWGLGTVRRGMGWKAGMGCSPDGLVEEMRGRGEGRTQLDTCMVQGSTKDMGQTRVGTCKHGATQQ